MRPLMQEHTPDGNSSSSRDCTPSCSVAGLTGRAIVSFQTIGWFGYYGQPTSAQPWQNQQLWDWSACCSEDISKNVFFGILYAIFGYTVSLGCS